MILYLLLASLYVQIHLTKGDLNVTFITANVAYAGTDAFISYTIEGTTGSTGKNDVIGMFEQGVVDTTWFNGSVGYIGKIRVDIVDNGLNSGWKFEKLIVTSDDPWWTKVWVCDCWMAGGVPYPYTVSKVFPVYDVWHWYPWLPCDVQSLTTTRDSYCAGAMFGGNCSESDGGTEMKTCATVGIYEPYSASLLRDKNTDTCVPLADDVKLDLALVANVTSMATNHNNVTLVTKVKNNKGCRRLGMYPIESTTPCKQDPTNSKGAWVICSVTGSSSQQTGNGDTILTCDFRCACTDTPLCHVFIYFDRYQNEGDGYPLLCDVTVPDDVD